MHSALTQHGEDLLCLIRTNIVIRKNALYIFNTLFDDLRIVGATILAQQKLKDIDRHIRTFLDFLGQILANNFAVKESTQLLIDDDVGIFR